MLRIHAWTCTSISPPGEFTEKRLHCCKATWERFRSEPVQRQRASRRLLSETCKWHSDEGPAPFAPPASTQADCLRRQRPDFVRCPAPNQKSFEDTDGTPADRICRCSRQSAINRLPMLSKARPAGDRTDPTRAKVARDRSVCMIDATCRFTDAVNPPRTGCRRCRKPCLQGGTAPSKGARNPFGLYL